MLPKDSEHVQAARSSLYVGLAVTVTVLGGQARNHTDAPTDATRLLIRWRWQCWRGQTYASSPAMAPALALLRSPLPPRPNDHPFTVLTCFVLALCTRPRRLPGRCVWACDAWCVRARVSLCVQGALVDKWNAVRAEVAVEERLDAQAEAPISLAVLEERKRKRLAEWKDSVTSSDTAERNTNFAPLGTGVADWRERVARAKQRKASER